MARTKDDSWDLRGRDYDPMCLYCRAGVAHSIHQRPGGP